jgi:integrase
MLIMASFFKRKRDRKRPGAAWYFAYTDERGVRRTRKGCPDKSATEAMARKLESEAAHRRRGVIDPRADAYAAQEARPLSAHLTDWFRALQNRGNTPKHAELSRVRAARVVAIVKGAVPFELDPETPTRANLARAAAMIEALVASARLSDLDEARVQAALEALRRAGRSHATVNHHRGAVRSFSRWLHARGRTREDALRGVTPYNAAEDRRHDRRTLALDELRRLIAAAHRGPTYQGMAGPARSLCYRVAVATGLRYSELKSLTTRSFDLDGRPARVNVAAHAAKNGKPASLALPDDVAADLAAHIAALPMEASVFPLPKKGAAMLRIDLAAAGISYRDAAGRVFDFHALHCQTATLADLNGASPRAIQALMRHSTLELSGRYTRPRVHDIDAVTAALPSLAPSFEIAPRGQTGTVSAAQDHRGLTALCQRAGDGSGGEGRLLAGATARRLHKCPVCKTRPETCLCASGRLLSGIAASGLEPETCGL